MYFYAHPVCTCLCALQESASVKVLAAISFCDVYTDRSLTDRSLADPERFQRAHRSISDKQFTHFVRPLTFL